MINNGIPSIIIYHHLPVVIRGKPPPLYWEKDIYDHDIIWEFHRIERTRKSSWNVAFQPGVLQPLTS